MDEREAGEALAKSLAANHGVDWDAADEYERGWWLDVVARVSMNACTKCGGSGDSWDTVRDDWTEPRQDCRACRGLGRMSATALLES